MSKLLLEIIADVKRLYPNISDEDFNRLIRLDPTFQSNRDSVGKYGKWILNLFNKDVLDNEGHLFDLLSRFEEAKPQLQVKDINRFKSMMELEDYLNDTSNYNELSRRQQLRKVQTAVRNTDISVDAEKVFEDYAWEVWIPHTYEASCKLGQGSRWCTATTDSDYYYNYYTQRGPLYILIDKYDTENKYQFHFETDSYMDKDDEAIDPFDDILDNDDELLEFFRPKILNSWDLPKDLTFDEQITITLNDRDFYQILDEIQPYMSRGEQLKGSYLYDILYSPDDYFDDSWYEFGESEFDEFVQELTPENKALLIQKLNGDLSYNALYKSDLYGPIMDACRQLQSEAGIEYAQNIILQKIENLFHNEIDVEWKFVEEFQLELSGPLTDFVAFHTYNEEGKLNLDNQLKNWIGCKIIDELSVFYNDIEDYSGVNVDEDELNQIVSDILN